MFQQKQIGVNNKLTLESGESDVSFPFFAILYARMSVDAVVEYTYAANQFFGIGNETTN